MNFEELKKGVEEQINRIRSDIERRQKKENKLMWHDIRKKLPEDDEMCLVPHEDDEGEQFVQRARFENGVFRSYENTTGFPLLVQKWLAIPKVDEE